jgi:hypothetical protein
MSSLKVLSLDCCSTYRNGNYKENERLSLFIQASPPKVPLGKLTIA